MSFQINFHYSVNNSIQIHTHKWKGSPFFLSEFCTSLLWAPQTSALSWFQEEAAGLDYPRMKLLQWGCSSGVCSCGRTRTDAFTGQLFSCSHQEKGMTNSTGSYTWRLQTHTAKTLTVPTQRTRGCRTVLVKYVSENMDTKHSGSYTPHYRLLLCMWMLTENQLCVYGHAGPQGKRP